MGESRNNAVHQFRAKLPGDNGDDELNYRWQELRTRLTQLENGLIICDGTFLDITDLKEQEKQLKDQAAALEREICHHRFTQMALEEAMDDIHEARHASAHQHQQRHRQQSRNTTTKKNRLDVKELLEDVESLTSLLEGSTSFAQKKWAGKILKGLTSKLNECLLNEQENNNDDTSLADDSTIVSEVTWDKH